MTIQIHDPGNTQKITSLWAFISQDENGHEGILASGNTLLGVVPLITADEGRLKSLRAIAELTVKQTTKKILLIRFDQREDLEVLK